MKMMMVNRLIFFTKKTNYLNFLKDDDDDDDLFGLGSDDDDDDGIFGGEKIKRRKIFNINFSFIRR